MPYTKLDAGLVHSTVWREPDAIRIVWITMLAMADRHGEVMASVPGLMDVARVSRDDVERALDLFLSPDPDSRTKAFEGRRIEAIPGGWLLLNHGEHRARGDAEDRKAKSAARQKRFRERHRPSLGPVLDGFEEPPAEPTVTQKRYSGVTGNAPSQKVTTSSKQSPEADTNYNSKSGARRVNANAPLVEAWSAHFGKGTGTAIALRLGVVLKRLRKHHDDVLLLDQWAKYLREVPRRVACPEHFEKKCGSWTGRPDTGNTTVSDGVEKLQRFRDKHRNGNA